MILSERPERLPNPELLYTRGVIIPMDRFWELRSGDVFGVIPKAQIPTIYPAYLDVLDRKLSDAHAIPRSSTIADIAEVARGQISTSHLLTRLMPWRFAPEIKELHDQARKDARQQRELSSDFRYIRDFLEGSDMDLRIDIEPHNMRHWAEDLKKQAQQRYEVREDKVQTESRDGLTIWRLPISKGILSVMPRDRVIDATSLHRDPLIEITYGTYANSGIPFCNWKLIAQARSYDPDLPEDRDLVLMSIGVAPQRSRLTPRMQALDTRTGPTINSWDIIDTAVFTNDVDHLEQYIPGAKDTLHQPSRQLLHPNGVASPLPYKDAHITDGKYVLPQGGKPWRVNGLEVALTKIITKKEPPPPVDAYQSFLYIPPDALSQLARPIAFGPEFGHGTPAQTLVEAFRVVRKALRYGQLEKSAGTQRAKTLVRGSHLMSQLRPELNSKHPNYWQRHITREAATSCWYSPKEFIHMGKRSEFNFAQYLPNWHFLEAIVDELPPRSAMLTNLQKDTQLLTSNFQDGWHLITQAVRRKNEQWRRESSSNYNADIEKKNDLSLIFWLLSVNF